jgi:hypothetical protein
MPSFIQHHPDKCGRRALIKKIDIVVCQQLQAEFVPKKKQEALEKKKALEAEVSRLQV